MAGVKARELQYEYKAVRAVLHILFAYLHERCSLRWALFRISYLSVADFQPGSASRSLSDRPSE